jgi:hypothetical protein
LTDVVDMHVQIAKEKQAFNNPLFMHIYAIATWELWKIRNAVIFDGLQPNTFLDSFGLEVQRLTVSVDLYQLAQRVGQLGS